MQKEKRRKKKVHRAKAPSEWKESSRMRGEPAPQITYVSWESGTKQLDHSAIYKFKNCQ